jgi:oxygen-independent coproporphyrinogen-3 oxidase
LSAASYPEPIATVYYGGGTPGLIQPELLEKVHRSLQQHLKFAEQIEVTIETTPDTITSSKLEQWQQIGVNRLSIGIESLHDSELSAIGRGQGQLAALSGLENVRASSFKNVSLDLMYGLPTQTKESWSNTLELALSFKFPHVSAYGLAVAKNSPLHKRFLEGSSCYPNEEAFCLMYKELVNRCEDKGLKQYEISNFAYPGYECRHNQTYWNNEEYYAFGVGAHRYVNSVRSANTRSLKQYMESCLTLDTEEIIDSQTAIREGILLALRTRSGLNFANFHKRYGIDPRHEYRVVIDKLASGGFIELSEDKMQLSKEGVLVSNLVLSEFF